MTRRWPLRVILAIGLGLALAPAVFQMFTRIPPGGGMIDDFAPYMTTAKIDSFTTDIATMGRARDEAVATMQAHPELAAAAPAVVAFDDAWPAIDADMSSILSTMRHNIGNYDGVAALPPFPLFPWFFVIPGVLIAGVAGVALARDRSGRPARGRRIALTALAVGLLAAPAVFQMFSRAPGGGEMISDFEPFMRSAKVTEIQGYFLTIGNGEGQLRRIVAPTVEPGTLADVATFSTEWPRISNEMAPMIGTMADNVDTFAGIAALPPFGLFPWFFVLPGLLILGLLAAAVRTPQPAAVPTNDGSSSAPVLEGA
jgi:hypothetical protein